MSKKVNPDPKTRTIQHINGTTEDSKKMVNSRGKEAVDVKWEKTPSWTAYRFGTPSVTENKDYKLFTEEGNSGNDDYDKES